jgi:hypothetical protein
MQITVFRIEYDILPMMNSYKAFIAAESHEKAVEYLNKILKGKKISITATGPMCPIHGFTDGVLNFIKPSQEPVKPVKNKEENNETETDDNEGIKFRSGRGVKKTKK